MPPEITIYAADDILSEREIDVKSWQNQVRDLHKVMETICRVWLLLQHANEPLVRIAIEILTSQHAKYIRSWKEDWWPDEEKREYLKRLVFTQLKRVLIFLQPDATVEDDVKKPGEDAELAEARKSAKEWEERFNKSEQARRLLEMQIRELEEREAEAQKRAKDMEDSMQKLKDEFRTLQAAGGDSGSEIDALRKKLAALEQELAQERDRSKQAVANASSTAAADAKTIADLRRQLQDAQQTIDKLQQQLKELERKLSTAQSRSTGLPPPQGDDGMADLKAQLQAALQAAEDAKRKVAQLEAELDRTRAKLSETEGKLSDAKAQLSDAEARAAAAEVSAAQLRADLASAPHDRPVAAEAAAAPAPAPAPSPSPSPSPPPPTATGDKGLSRKEEEQLRQEIARLKDLLAKERAENKRLCAENQALEEKLLRALEMIQKLKQQLEKLQAIAESKGNGELVQKLLEESGLKETLNSDEFSVFGRLYEDALRRQAKYKKWLEAHGGGEIHFHQFKKSQREKSSPPPGEYVAGRAWFHGKYFVTPEFDENDLCPTCGRLPPPPVNEPAYQRSVPMGDGSVVALKELSFPDGCTQPGGQNSPMHSPIAKKSVVAGVQQKQVGFEDLGTGLDAAARRSQARTSLQRPSSSQSSSTIGRMRQAVQERQQRASSPAVQSESFCGSLLRTSASAQSLRHVPLTRPASRDGRPRAAAESDNNLFRSRGATASRSALPQALAANPPTVGLAPTRRPRSSGASRSMLGVTVASGHLPVRQVSLSQRQPAQCWDVSDAIPA